MRRAKLLLVTSLLALGACHSNGGYFEDDPVLKLGPGCPECPSRARWNAYYGHEGTPYSTSSDAGSPDVAAEPSLRDR